MLKESQLFSLLDKVLSQSAYIRKGEEAVYFCPFCSHYKKKLEVNVRTQEWHCWICNSRGRSISSLFFKLKAKEQFFNELYNIIGKGWKRSEEQPKHQIFSLPDEFIPLWKPSKGLDYGHAMAYLSDRHVSVDDIIRYGIGYCEKGQYEKRVIIPSHDKDGNLNFFSARAYVESRYKYMLPPWPKTIVGNEIFVNWKEPITLVEGSFDALAVRKNAIPLFGTTLTTGLKLAIIKNGVKRVNIVLDNDALKQSIDIYDDIEDLQVNDIAIHLIRLGDKDPSFMGFGAVTDMINKSSSYGFSDIIRVKLDLCR